MKAYKGRIQNITTGQWVSDETQGKCTYTKFKKNACVFNEEEDALNTIEMLNDIHGDCFTLIDNK